MNTITTQDGTQIYYKDWGAGQPILFSHVWPLSSDSWAAALNSAKLVKNAILKIYPGAPHGLADTHKEQLNADLQGFLNT